MDMAWHYTTGQKFIEIVSDGYLNPKATVTPQGTRPIVWFSLAEHWEPTAQKSLNTGELQGMVGTCEHGGGLLRFGVPYSSLIPWPKLGRKAGIDPTQIKALECVGVQQGAIPANWCGSLKRIHIRSCLVDCFDSDTNEWQRVQGKGK